MQAEDLSSLADSHQYDIGSSEDGASEGRKVVAAPIQGREIEKLEVLEAYQRVLQTHEAQVAFVHGSSGQGKTSLVDSLREPVNTSNGFFCAGKFFQDSQIQEPYSAITAAFSDLCDLVVQSPHFDEQERVRIQEGLALDSHLLSRSINLTPFGSVDSMGLDRNDSTASKPANFARFRLACKNFLLTMSSEKHPLVVFLDDVQWMDDGSQKLIEMFIRDEDIKNILFVMCYRDEESCAVAGILQSPGNREITDIQLTNLDLAGVRLIVASSLPSVTGDIDQLSELALQRSGGNPFFVCLFLETIKAEGFLTFNGSIFDVGKIRAEIMVQNLWQIY